MELDYKAIGKRIKIARIKKNLTQEAIADKIGITPQHVSNIETGNASVSLTTLVAIANTLTVSVNDLLCDFLYYFSVLDLQELCNPQIINRPL